MLRRPQASERGFTMIELLVAMVLLGILIGGVVYAVSQLGKGSSSLSANRNAQRDALDAMEQMRHDVSAARSPALEQFDDRRDSLRDLIYFRDDSRPPDPDDRSRNLCGGARGNAYVECLTGIAHAGPDQVWFRADVNNTDGSVGDCIGYVVSGGALRRYQSTNWRGCGPSAGGQQTILLQARALATPGGGNIFSYTLRYQPNMRQGTIPDPQGCRTFQTSTPTGAQRTFISTIDINLAGVAQRRDQAALAGLRTSVSVSAHVAGDYAFATGCAP